MNVTFQRVDEGPRTVQGFELRCAVGVGDTFDHAGIQVGIMANSPVPGRDIAVSVCAPTFSTLIALLTKDEAFGLFENLGELLMKRAGDAQVAQGIVQ